MLMKHTGIFLIKREGLRTLFFYKYLKKCIKAMTFSAKQFRELNDAYKSMYVPATEEEVTQEEAPVEEVKEVEESAAGMMSGQQSAQGSSQQVARAQQRLKDLSNRIKQGYETIVPPPQRSNEPTVRSGERTPQTGMSYVASRDKSGERYDKSGTPAPAKLDPGTRGSTMPSRPQFKGVGARSGSAAAPVKTPTPPPAPPSQPAAPAPAAPAAPAPAARPVVKQTGDKATDMGVWRKSNPTLAKRLDAKNAAKRSVTQKTPDLKYDKSLETKAKGSLGTRLATALSGPASAFKYNPKTNEAYDVVLEYLLSQGHADTVDEANYIMMEMDVKTIQSIVESPSFEVKGGNPSAARRQGKINKAADAGVPNAAAKAKGPILPIKGV